MSLKMAPPTFSSSITNGFSRGLVVKDSKQARRSANTTMETQDIHIYPNYPSICG